MTRWIGLAGASLAIGLLGMSPTAQARCSNSDFCAGWRVVCHRTLPKGANPKECTRRHAECLKTGCYFFNNPRARCKNNPADLALTTSCQRRR